jgi:hypothetical protein
MMSVDHLFQAYVNNVHTITLGFALGTLTLLVIYLLNSLKDDGIAGEAVSSGSLQNIEEALKKVLEGARFSAGATADSPATTSGLTSGTTETVGARTDRPVMNVIDNEELNRLKVQAVDRESKLIELETALAKVLKQSAEKGSEESLKSLNMQVKDLEAKLAEYEIIEDDIANLTTYKEENNRLKDELARLKNTGSAIDLSEVAVATTEPEIAVDEQLMAEFEAAVEEQKKSAAATAMSVGPSVGTGPGSSQSTPPTAIDDALMKEFADAVKPATPIASTIEPAEVEAASAPETKTASAPEAHVEAASVR